MVYVLPSEVKVHLPEPSAFRVTVEFPTVVVDAGFSTGVVCAGVDEELLAGVLEAGFELLDGVEVLAGGVDCGGVELLAGGVELTGAALDEVVELSVLDELTGAALDEVIELSVLSAAELDDVDVEEVEVEVLSISPPTFSAAAAQPESKTAHSTKVKRSFFIKSPHIKILPQITANVKSAVFKKSWIPVGF